MIKFKVTKQLDFWSEESDDVEFQLYYMNSSNIWESLGSFDTVEGAKDYAVLFASVFKEEEFSI